MEKKETNLRSENAVMLPILFELNAVKMVLQPTMNFKNFSVFVTRYGAENRFVQVEEYLGYFILQYIWPKCDVVRFIGKLYRIESREHDGQTQTVLSVELTEDYLRRGCADYRWIFRYASFAPTAKKLQEKGLLSSAIDVEAIDEALKNKVISAMCHSGFVELSDEEALIFRTCFGDRFKKFFYDFSGDKLDDLTDEEERIFRLCYS